MFLGTRRALRALTLALRGWSTITFGFPRMSQPQRELAVRDWARAMLRVLGIVLEVRGTPPARGPLLIVSNHISWLDILVMHAAGYCRFVSKSEVRRWPLVGTLATGAGTLFIERERKRDAVRVVHHMAEALRAGEVVAIFPEGTTTDGRHVLPFHANLLQAAISADAPVLPVALRFVDAATGELSDSARYVDDDTLVGSVWRTVAGRPFKAVVSFGEAQAAQGRDRRQWAAALREEVVRLGA